MIYSIRHSSRHDSHIPILLVYLGFQHALELSNHPQGPGFCLLYYCAEGKGEFTLNGKRSILQPGQCFLALPDAPFSCKAMPDGCVIHLLGFTGPCAIDVLRICGMEESGIYQLSNAEIFPNYMARFYRLHQQNSTQETYSKLCYGLLLDLFPCIQKLSEVQPVAPVNDTIQMVIEYLETHYQESISLDTLADEVHLTKEYLCVLFRKEMQHTILQHLTLIRIGWARLYLEQYPDKKAYEIGKMCGFDSPSYFGKRFKEIVGVTPESYRHVTSIKV